jgi:sodium transport system permease protein
MKYDESTSPESEAIAVGGRDVLGRLGRLVLKELREILRDRRTIITLVVMPILVYPLLALVFQRFLFTSLKVEGQPEYVIGVESELAQRMLEQRLLRGEAALNEQQSELRADGDEEAEVEAGTDRPPIAVLPGFAGSETDEPVIHWAQVSADEAEKYVKDSTLHLAVMYKQVPDDPDEVGLENNVTWELIFCPGSPTSEQALRYVEARLRALNNTDLDVQLKRLGVAAQLAAPFRRHAVQFAGAPPFSLAALIPLILVLMTVTGAVYPAIDLTAGERERGTLETLIAAPVPRLGLLLGKYVAVLTVALLTAVVNLVGMTITAHSTGLSASLFGESGMSPLVVIKVLMLLSLFAAFFSAILLAITSYARSFKEAQAYIIPLMLLCLVPGVLCLMPGLEFHGILAITPLVNIVLLARDVLEGGVDASLAVAAVLSTALYVVAAIALAARIFGTDAILYGSPTTWADVFRRPATLQPAGSVSAAMFCLAMMFPSYFVLASSLTRSEDIAMRNRLILCGLITAIVFGGIPLIVAMFNRIRLSSGMGLRVPGMVGLLAAALLGLVLWPVAHEVFLVNQWLGMAEFSDQQLASVRDLLEQWRGLSFVLIAVTLAVAPGVFEELFFRGFLFSSLRTTLSAGTTIVVTALLFGVFHVVTASVLAPERFLPSVLLGLVLGWVRLRTGSVVPCMVLHTVHNGLLLSITYWQDQISRLGFGVEEQTHLPLIWLVLAGLGILVAVFMLIAATRKERLQPAVGVLE